MAGYGYDEVVPYATVAEFSSAEELMTAANAMREAGFKRMDAYSPFPVHGLSEAIGFHDVKVPWLIFFGGLTGGIGGYTLQYYTAVIDYPLNVGGRPLNSIVAFIPVTYESTILLAALTAVFGMLALNGLPKFYHPIFNTPGFERASQDRFYLAVEADDPKYDRREVRRLLEGLKPLAVNEVTT